MINKVLRLFQGCDGRVSERLFSNVMLLEFFIMTKHISNPCLQVQMRKSTDLSFCYWDDAYKHKNRHGFNNYQGPMK